MTRCRFPQRAICSYPSLISGLARIPPRFDKYPVSTTFRGKPVGKTLRRVWGVHRDGCDGEGCRGPNFAGLFWGITFTTAIAARICSYTRFGILKMFPRFKDYPVTAAFHGKPVSPFENQSRSNVPHAHSTGSGRRPQYSPRMLRSATYFTIGQNELSSCRERA